MLFWELLKELLEVFVVEKLSAKAQYLTFWLFWTDKITVKRRIEEVCYSFDPAFDVYKKNLIKFFIFQVLLDQFGAVDFDILHLKFDFLIVQGFC